MSNGRTTSTVELRAERQGRHDTVLNEVEPPPKPLFLQSTGPATVGGAGAGAVVGGVFNVLEPASRTANGLAEASLLFHMVLGAIVGGIFNGVGSIIYNAIVKKSNTGKLKRIYPETKDLNHDELLTWWVQMKLAALFSYVDETFQKKGPGTP